MRRINIPWIRGYFIDWHRTFPFAKASWQEPEKEVAAEWDCVKTAGTVNRIQNYNLQKRFTIPI